MPAFNKPPKLVNRGPAGLLNKKEPSKEEHSPLAPMVDRSNRNKIAKALRDAGLVHPIDQFILDPENARLHGERNMESIKDSLALYGQVKPIVVRSSTGIVVAGNGTITAARELGWTEIAATLVDMNEIEAAGYGLADNRTAELAKWNFEVVARLDKLLLDAGSPSIGWSEDELEVLRAAEWTPPPISDEAISSGAGQEQLLHSFTPDQYAPIIRAINLIKEKKKTISDEEAISLICAQWAESETKKAHAEKVVKDVLTSVQEEKAKQNATVQKTQPSASAGIFSPGKPPVKRPTGI